MSLLVKLLSDQKKWKIMRGREQFHFYDFQRWAEIQKYFILEISFHTQQKASAYSYEKRAMTTNSVGSILGKTKFLYLG